MATAAEINLSFHSVCKNLVLHVVLDPARILAVVLIFANGDKIIKRPVSTNLSIYSVWTHLSVRSVDIFIFEAVAVKTKAMRWFAMAYLDPYYKTATIAFSCQFRIGAPS